MSRSISLARFALAVALLSLVAACGKNATGPQQGAGGNMPPPEVAVITVAPAPVALTSELPGRVQATRTAQVRARVEGIVQKRVFREGGEVKAGQLLFVIDPTTMRANVDVAQAALRSAEANAAQAKAKAERFAPLAKSGIVSKQQNEEIVAQAAQAAADVQSARAALVKAKQDLSFTNVTAPISGYIGLAQVTEGALVGKGEATPLATIEQIDPVYVNFTQSSVDFSRIKRAIDAGKLKAGADLKGNVRLKLEDGTDYPHRGQLLSSEYTVDPSTGEVTMRAQFPNPNRNLLPGMFLRIIIDQAVDEKAITVPQRALMRNPQGASVMIVGADGNVVPVPVKVSHAQGDQWIVAEGLKGGERVIVEGLQKVKPGAPAKPVPFNPVPATASAPAAAPAVQAAAPQTSNAK